MSARSREPSRLDVEPFAREAGELEGQWPLRQLRRLAESTHAEARPAESDVVSWQARGELRPVRGAPPQPWLHLSAQTSLNLECQRCLQPMAVSLQVSRSFCFVHGEAAAATLDAESEDDVLALTRALDLRELVEDELLLSLPLVPRHDSCAPPMPLAASEPEPAEERPNPFAALAALKRPERH
ncbi:MAG TPA: YceD family protein [Piscinibacter sp.]|jgi:uncharacterized protein|nr:DUF177 domain-containing protein [Piscinibacter sp.]HOY35694.1 YceD family protein [Piscinibacter sp.]HPG77619.1 YceD family protein [Piscinibacter sp.]HPM66396.1 YceD family protein [Piscinibacter sp.]